MRETEVIDHDGMVERDRFGRWGFAFGAISLFFVLPTALGMKMAQVMTFSGSSFLLGGVGFFCGLLLTAAAFSYFFVLVPQKTACVTLDTFNRGPKGNVIYGPGFHAKYPWEQWTEKGHLPLDILTIRFEQAIPTANAEVTITGSLVFRFSLPYCDVGVGIDADDIETGFVRQIKGWLTEQLRNTDADMAKASMPKLREDAENHFRKTLEQYALTTFGVTVVSLFFDSIAFSGSVQAAQDAKKKARDIKESIVTILGYSTVEEFDAAFASGAITKQDLERARDDLLVLSGHATKTISGFDFGSIDNRIGDMIALLVSQSKRN